MRKALFMFVCLPAFGWAAEEVLTEENSWAFRLPADPFTEEALLDLRSLNEEASGQSGFIRLSEDGNSFVRGDGEPIRFWAVGTDAWRFTPEQMDEHCRWLAKLGVNFARLHVTVVKRDGGIRELDEKVITGTHRFIKAAKENGIYVLISPFYAHFDVPAEWGLEGGKQNAEGLIFFNEKVQDAYRYWVKEFYGRVNPHTGLPIAKDPTVAVIQVHNEDSLLFWTQQAISEAQKKVLGRRFGDWLAAEHGSLEAAFAAWGDDARSHEHDDPAAGVAGVHDIYFLTQDWSGGTARRMRDQTRFLGEFQREFYAGMGRYLREEIGCRQLLNATNWRTANDARLKAVERHTYHALEVDAENEYVGSDYQHIGENKGYRIDPGHYLVNESVLGKPFEMCTNWRQEEGHPFILTETAWKNPNRYQSEGPFLVAAYQSLNGVDAIFWFSCQTPRYEENPLKSFWRVGDQFSTHKWNHCYPAMMAGFPANALLFRKGYLKEAERPVVLERRTMDEIWDREAPSVVDDEIRGDARDHPQLQPGWQAEEGEINQAVYQVGPVMSVTGADESSVEAIDLAPYFDPGEGTIRSLTGELLWDYRRELCRMDAPKAQGVTGFLARNGGTFELSDVTIDSRNDYATVNVVALDDRPIRQSESVLVQVVTVNRLSGWETRDVEIPFGRAPEGREAPKIAAEQIVRMGEPPFRIANTEVAVTVANPGLKRAVVLDINGYPVREIPVESGRFAMPADAIYAVLRP